MTETANDDLVQDGLLRWAEKEPGRPAVIDGDHVVSFGALVQNAKSLASEFDRLNARRIGLCLPNSSLVLDVFFGALMAGGCACVFDPAWPESVLRTLVQRHAPNVFVGSPDLLSKMRTESERTNWLTPNDVYSVVSAKTGPVSVKAQPTADMPFLIGFTSGSSGTPKAFIRNHRTWIESFRHSATEFGTCSDDIVLAPGPLSHGLSLYAAVEAISTGATVCIEQEFDADAVSAAIRSQQATMLVVVPTMLDLLLDVDRDAVMTGVTRIITAGAKLSPALRQRVAAVFLNADLIEYYGASELSFITVAKGSEDCPPDSVGRAFAGVEIGVQDDAGAAVASGQTGTIWVKSAMLSSGYVGPTDGSGFRTDGDWATVGDLGHQDSDGYLYLDGREGSVITTSGYTVYPSAIETTLIRHPDVLDAAVLPLADERWGEVIAAAVVVKQDSTITGQDLSAFCHQELEPYACPRRWRIVASLERTASGKISRQALQGLFE